MSRARLILPAITLAALFAALPVYAQFTLTGDLSIDISPAYPTAGQTVQLTADSAGLDLADSAIVWHANGKVIAQGLGAQTATLVAGTLGTQTNVEVDVSSPDGSVYSAQATIAPTQVDVLVDSDSYTPPFYLGRALPSAGTNLILQAMAHFKRADGTLIPDSQITYTWKQSGEVLGNLSGRGRSSAVIPIMHLYGGNVITVDAISSDGTRSGEGSIDIPLTQPIVDLYEDHPLYGILYNQALGASATIPDSEMAFAAIPYFADARGINDPQLSYAWRVNDTDISHTTGSASEITINADNSNGQAALAVEVTHATNFYMDATGAWNISFSSGPTQNPFSNTH